MAQKSSLIRMRLEMILKSDWSVERFCAPFPCALQML